MTDSINHAKPTVCLVLAIAVLINRLNTSSVTVGVDGTLYRHHEKFKKNLTQTISRLVPRTVNIIHTILLNLIVYFL
jgi:hexokinase